MAMVQKFDAAASDLRHVYARAKTRRWLLWCVRCSRQIAIEHARRYHVPVDLQLFGRQSERQAYQLRKVQNRHFQFLLDILFHFGLETVEDGVTKRAGRDHGRCSAGLCGKDLFPGQLDRDPLVVSGSMKSAAFGAAAILDRLAAQDFGKPLKGAVIAGIDKPVMCRRTSDMAAVKGCDRKACERIDHLLPQSRFADFLVQDPEEMTDLGASAVMQVLSRKP